MQAIKIQLLHPDAKLPARAHPTDACYDVVAVSTRSTDQYREYGLGFATEIPPGWQGLIFPRSSISTYDLALANSVGVVDAGYRGEWVVRFRYTDAGPRHVYGIGSKVAQIQFQRVPEVRFELVGSLAPSPRDTGGFGSTGR